MATYGQYTPTSLIAKAMFNFDAFSSFGFSNFTLNGTVRVSVSDGFSNSDFNGASYSDFDSDLWTASSEMAWTAQMTANVQEVLGIYAQFADIVFDWRDDIDSGAGP